MPLLGKRKLGYKTRGGKRFKLMGRKKAYHKNRRYNWRSSRPKTLTIFKSPSNPWPLRAAIKLKASFRFTLTHGAADDLQSKLFRANSIFDPDVAVGGHTVNGHDVYSGMYKRYRVYGVNVRIQKIATSGSANSVARMFIRGVPSAAPTGLSSVTSPEELSNIPKLSYKATTISTGSPSNVATMRKYFTVDYIEGRRTGSDDDYTSAMAANPTTVPLIEIGQCLYDGPVVGTEALFIVDLTYDVRLYETTLSVFTPVAT